MEMGDCGDTKGDHQAPSRLTPFYSIRDDERLPIDGTHKDCSCPLCCQVHSKRSLGRDKGRDGSSDKKQHGKYVTFPHGIPPSVACGLVTDKFYQIAGKRIKMYIT